MNGFVFSCLCYLLFNAPTIYHFQSSRNVCCAICFPFEYFFPLSAFKIVVNLNYHDDVFSFHRFCVLYFAVFSSCVSVVSALCSRYLYML